MAAVTFLGTSDAGLPTRLLEAIARAGMTQADAARALGSDNRRVINELTSGRRNLQADLDLVARLANVLTVRPAWLAGWED